MGGKKEFFENFERKKYLKKLPSMQRVKVKELTTTLCLHLGMHDQGDQTP